MVAEGLTKCDLDERRERYLCMKRHPGRYCRDCNPRANNIDLNKASNTENEKCKEKPSVSENEESGDEDEDEDAEVALSDESADISDCWSDGSDESDGSNESGGVWARLPTYNEIWYEEEDRQG